ncbi:MAG: HEAT repeat domain-containing protein [Gemmataceae bacterium]
MPWIRYGLVLTVMTASVAATQGGIFGRRQTPEQSANRVAQLIVQAQTETNYYKRATAISQLREYSAAKYPEIIPVLVQALQTDQAITVRIEAARSLGRIRPLTSMAKSALSHASTGDSAFRVRWQARTSLMYYNVVGLNPNNHAKSGGNDPKVVISPPSGSPRTSPLGAPGELLVPSHPTSVEYPRPLPKGPAAPLKPKQSEPPLAVPVPVGSPQQPRPVEVPPIPLPHIPVAPPPLQGNPNQQIRTTTPPVLLAPPPE